ncbi:DUF2851 family protein [Parabacteroides sp. 52]|uniref:DUF2851 family protein n=1 Tax=unclassified Parabacteroides TaxID=2649774 RepID=UPI0013D18393|nr:MULTISPECIES: DUF2851 family protein [unclassified Parabacteroides]MDH6534369.1 hypothetical protein [Parabacteroides sp. PM5-20]NDV54867.1 DUF2851 family protein [Parabacteroides sp. 52]
MERLLHYVWKYKLYDASTLTTTDGVSFQVLDPGIHNTDAGPDFFNAKIKIENTVWAGSIEIHEKASDWIHHHHDRDKAYDSVILHVTGLDDARILRTTGEPIPQVILTIPENIRENIDWLLHQETAMPCLPYIREIEPLHCSVWLAALLEERLERKTADILSLLEQYNNDWNEVFYITLTRNFGFGVNSDAFEWLAKSLPFHCIQKHRCNHAQVEAMLFGQAGMLEYPGHCPYYLLLQREYRFLKHKFGLKPLDASLFKNLRLRPGNFPHQRLAQLAALWVRYDTLFSLILEITSPNQIKKYFRILPSAYWQTHYHFRHASPVKEKTIGEESLNVLLINTVVPMLFAYGQHANRITYCERANTLLEKIPPEKNNIVYTFRKAGIEVRHAGDSQALIQLKRAYCDQKKCLYCRIGFRFLKRSTVPVK